MIRVCIATALAVSLCSVPARADDDVCFVAALSGQKLRRAGDLVGAGDEFRTCAQESCPAEVVERCDVWLEEVVAATPSVVLVARDAEGREITRGEITIDGRRVDGAFSGKATALNPGPHTFRLFVAGAVPLTSTVLVREGEKSRRVELSLPSGRRPASPPPAPPQAASASPLAWVLIGVGVVGAGVFSYAAISGLQDRARFGCDRGCAPDDYDTVQQKFWVANIALPTSLLAFGGATWVFLSPPAPSGSASLGVITHF